MDLQITVAESKAKQFVSFLKQLDFVVVNKTIPAPKKTLTTTKKKVLDDKDFPYFGACPNWEIDAKTLREQSNNRTKSLW